MQTLTSGDILFLGARDLRALMPFSDCVVAVAEAFRLVAAGQVTAPLPMEIHAGARDRAARASGILSA
jgi:hypothetical protein